MRLFVSIVLLSVVSSSWAQGQVDPAYLRQYYSALQQQGGQPRQAAPIYEQQEPAPRFTQPAQAVSVVWEPSNESLFVFLLFSSPLSFKLCYNRENLLLETKK